MQLARALGLGPKEVVTLVGGGGKTTLMFRLAAELVAAGRNVVTTMTTRIFVGQMGLAPASLVLEGEEALFAQLPPALREFRHVLVAGDILLEQDKVQGLAPDLVDRIRGLPEVDMVIVEADGSRRRPLKAPAPHEPVVPASTTIAVPLVGLDVLGQPLTAEYVHRPQLVAELTGAAIGDPVTPAMIATVLSHPCGGAKNVPPGARLIPFLNKVEDEAQRAAARETARLLLQFPRVDRVVLGATQADDPVAEVWTSVSAVVLAAGQAKRFGALKQILPWGGSPLVAHVADQALACQDVNRVAVTVGARADEVRAALGARDVQVVPVADWEQGQSSSVLDGLLAVASPEIGRSCGAVLFLLADQPGVSPALLSALIARHRETLAPVVAPRYRGLRGNPVLFDRTTFAEFAALRGDIGARPIIQAHEDQIAWVDWPSSEITRDLDTPADYEAANS